jgi:hypothetical protein
VWLAWEESLPLASFTKSIHTRKRLDNPLLAEFHDPRIAPTSVLFQGVSFFRSSDFVWLPSGLEVSAMSLEPSPHVWPDLIDKITRERLRTGGPC